MWSASTDAIVSPCNWLPAAWSCRCFCADFYSSSHNSAFSLSFLWSSVTLANENADRLPWSLSVLALLNKIHLKAKTVGVIGVDGRLV